MGKVIQQLGNLYWEQISGIKIVDRDGDYKEIQKGVCSGYALFPDF